MQPAPPLGALLAALLAPALATPLAAQLYTETQILSASDGGSTDELGYGVGIADDFCVGGAWKYDVPGLGDVGAAYVYRLGGGGWTEEALLLADDSSGGEDFGADVDCSESPSGEVVLVGAPDADTIFCCDESGACYVFRNALGSWSQEAKLIASDAAQNDSVGFDVAIDGEVAVMTSVTHRHLGARQGGAYVFRHDGAGGWVEEAELLTATGTDFNAFGRSCDVSGDVVVVGAPLEDSLTINDTGAVFVFRWDGVNWIEEGPVYASDASLSDDFGESVAINGDLLAVGANDRNTTLVSDAGAIYVYRYDGANWNEEAILVHPNPQSNDSLGLTCAISGDTVFGGSRVITTAGTNAGAVWMWRYDGSGWTVEGELIASDATSDTDFSHDIKATNDRLLIGAPEADTVLGGDAGQLYVFEDCVGTTALAASFDVTLDPVCGGAPTVTALGSLAGATVGALVSAPFTYAAGMDGLDGCDDFRWVVVETEYSAGGTAAGADPLLGTLPAIGPANAGAGCDVDASPYWYSDAEWAANLTCDTGSATRADGVDTVFRAQPTDAAGSNVQRTFRTYLVRPDAGGASTFEVLGGFAWNFNSETGASLFCGEVSDGVAQINAALANGGFGGFTALAPSTFDPTCGSLRGDVASISVSAGGTQTLTLDAGPDCGGRVYLLFGGVSGTAPGIVFNGVPVPLNVDGYTFFTLLNPNTPPLANSLAVLTGAGEGSASFSLPPGSDPSLAGLTAHHVFVTMNAAATSPVAASNPVLLDLLP